MQAADDTDVNEKLVISYLEGNIYIHIHIHKTTVSTWTGVLEVVATYLVFVLPVVSKQLQVMGLSLFRLGIFTCHKAEAIIVSYSVRTVCNNTLTAKRRGHVTL